MLTELCQLVFTACLSLPWPQSQEVALRHFSRPDSERHYKQKTRVWEDCAAPPGWPCSLSTAAHTSWQSRVSASLASPLWVHSHRSVDLNGLTAFVGFSNLFLTLKIAQLFTLPAWPQKSMQTHLWSRMRSPRWELVRGTCIVYRGQGSLINIFKVLPPPLLV